jgi:hypothetical protein
VVGGGGLVVIWWCFGGGLGSLGVVDIGRREGGFCGVFESDGKKVESDLNRSREKVPLEGKRSPSC